MKVSCDSCGASCDIAVDGPTLLKRALPKRWRPRRIDGRVYILCDVCGNLRQFVGGLSPYLQARLNLPPNVDIEFPEYTELPEPQKPSALVRAERTARANVRASPMTDINQIITSGLPNVDPDRAARMQDVFTAEQSRKAAEAEQLALSAEHLAVVRVLKEQFVEHGPSGSARELADLLEARFADHGGRRYLYELFPGGPVSQGCRIAGVPMPSGAQDASFGSVF